MKQKSFTRLICLVLILNLCYNAQASYVRYYNLTADSLIIQPKVFTRANLVKIFPNSANNGSISISSTTREDLHFYVFDLEATLVYNITLSNKSKKVLTNLKKGVYTYDVFKNDESIQQGTIIVK